MAKSTQRPNREQEMREILAFREAEGLTMRELASASGVPAGTLCAGRGRSTTSRDE